MSLVAYTPIATYSSRGVALGINSIYTAIQACDPLTAPNYGEEGLDVSRFNSPAQPAPALIADETSTSIDRTTLATSAGWTNLVLGAVPIATGAITTLADDILRVRVIVQMESTVSSSVGLKNCLFGIAIAYTVSGVTTRVTNTERYHSRVNPIIAHDTLRTISTRIGAVSLDAVRVQYHHPHGAIGTASVGSATICATIFRRIS